MRFLDLVYDNFRVSASVHVASAVLDSRLFPRIYGLHITMMIFGSNGP